MQHQDTTSCTGESPRYLAVPLAAGTLETTITLTQELCVLTGIDGVNTKRRAATLPGNACAELPRASTSGFGKCLPPGTTMGLVEKVGPSFRLCRGKGRATRLALSNNAPGACGPAAANKAEFLRLC